MMFEDVVSLIRLYFSLAVIAGSPGIIAFFIGLSDLTRPHVGAIVRGSTRFDPYSLLVFGGIWMAVAFTLACVSGVRSTGNLIHGEPDWLVDRSTEPRANSSSTAVVLHGLVVNVDGMAPEQTLSEEATPLLEHHQAGFAPNPDSSAFPSEPDFAPDSVHAAPNL
ncbi:MAG: hypothetical protein KAT71_00480 [Gammaproteobacteria bacterium]|nr:hypothetical protein [Gammaproteobacteria bacterium]